VRATIPPKVRKHVYERDGGCLGPRIGMPGICIGWLTIDHILNAGLGQKCEPDPLLLASLCVGHHRQKTDRANLWRPVLLAKVSELEQLAAEGRFICPS
jgi:hypothetical protein